MCKAFYSTMMQKNPNFWQIDVKFPKISQNQRYGSYMYSQNGEKKLCLQRPLRGKPKHGIYGLCSQVNWFFKSFGGGNKMWSLSTSDPCLQVVLIIGWTFVFIITVKPLIKTTLK
jgi:hypothetical protein